MEVTFRRTGASRYAITVHRPGTPPVVMDPAPGYDPLAPHDLLHLVVEDELGLDCGIFVQLARGGDAGTLVREADPSGSSRERTRRRRAARRGAALLREGRRESAESERATLVCLHAWLARSSDPARRARARDLALAVSHLCGVQSAAERRRLDADALSRICARLDALSARWKALAVGESMTVAWRAASS